MYPTPRSHRPLIMGRNGAVGANHPLATQAGLDTLRAGGNAVDAAVAISLTLGVVEPMMSGLGGDGFYQVHIAGQPKGLVYNGTGPAPIAATPEAFPQGMSVHGPRSVSVPGSLAGIAAMHAAHGRLPWAKLAEPAIEHARYGFAATHAYRMFSTDNRPQLAADPRSRMVFLAEAETRPLAGLVVQPDLANTLEAIAADGAETFYRGRLAQRLAAGLAEAGSLVAEADLAACEAEVQAPIAIQYRGYEVRQTPPNSTGFVMLEMLRIVEQFDLAGMDPAQRVHVLVEAKKRAFLDRERYGADPRFETVPIEHLLSDAVAHAHAAAISMDHAADLPLKIPEKAEGDTTYFCVIDAEGNAVSGIQSINSSFGSGVTAGDTGVLMNNRMAYWHLDPAHPNRLQPGKRVRHTMNAPMVFQDGKLWGVLGTPGADNQVQVNLQVLTAMLDLGADPQTAIERPRWTSSQPGQGANWPHAGDGVLTIENDIGDEVLAGLEARGHVLNRVAHMGGPCSMQAIRLMPNGVRMAASDTRRDGWAGAY
ncbi:gamma-glutamyltransferase [Acidisphaera sp. L21]|uniref:gamma-glutamyltransferase n=1 Tax=Acidisphaera sp. L21 TaxID=1641851 RepID=UPI00131C99D8|nr:gamma-glutamyltransferase [Acidisphaera sp. L21]